MLAAATACTRGGEQGTQITPEPTALPLPVESSAPKQSAGHNDPDETQADQPLQEQTLSPEAQSAYRAALEGCLEGGMLPDGTELGCDEGADMSQNKFAVYDVDGDGRDELIVVYVTTYIAGQTLCIFDYDDVGGALRTELMEYPLFTLYDNGVIKAGWSHNQGLAGEFWPYTLYRYDSANDSYAHIGMVDAWDGRAFPTGTDGGEYPHDVDVSGSGTVYYIMDGVEYDVSKPVDVSVYDEWVESHIGRAQELEIEYSDLSAESIEGI